MELTSSPLCAALGRSQSSSSSDSGAARRDVGCCGYVGQGARPATEYHERDFDWEEHAASVRHIVEAQEAEALSLRLQREQEQGQVRELEREGAQPAEPGPSTQQHATQRLPSCAAGAGELDPQPLVRALATGTSALESARVAGQGGRQGKASTSGRGGEGGSSPGGVQPGTGAPRDAVTRPVGSAAAGATSSAAAAYDGSKWEEFYRAHPSAKFFKERRYLLLEFPDLLRSSLRQGAAPAAQRSSQADAAGTAAGGAEGAAEASAGVPGQRTLHVVEIGAGCGSAVLPVLKANPASRATCTDISTTCLEQLQAAAAAEGIAPDRVAVFPADATDPAAAPAFQHLAADCLLIMFTLSAVVPEQQAVMLSHAFAALAPGGKFMIRDHGLYDMVQLRIPAEQWVAPNLYKRGDGTMAYFFSTEDLAARAVAAGFEVQECKYVTVCNRNRKSGLELRRVFVHGLFVKPVGAPVTRCG